MRRGRQFFQDADVAVGVVTGLVGGFALIQLAQSFAIEMVLSTVLNAISRSGEFDWGGVTFDFTATIAAATTIAIVVAAIYVVFVWARASADQDERATRECPECKSAIRADARRCRFCTSAVEPTNAAPA